MRVLLLTDELLPGGVSRHVIDLAHGLVGRGIDVAVAATDGPWRNLLKPPIDFIDLKLLKPNSFHKSILGFPRAVYRLHQYLSRNKTDIIHSHKRYSDLIGRILSRRFHIPHISTCHNTFHTYRHLSVFGDITIAPSKIIQRMLQEKFGVAARNIRQIYLGRLPLKEYTAGEKQRIKKLIEVEDKTIVASVGRVDADKDRKTLLLAIKRLDDQKLLEHVVFIIVGDGDLKPAMIRMAEELQIQQRIKFLASDFNIESIFNIADFCVLSSIRDGGILYVNLEAASLSKPHIATKVGGIPEFIFHEKTGLLVEPRQPEQLAEQIQRLLTDPAFVKELGAHANQLFYERHTYDLFIQNTLSVYQDALSVGN